MRPEAMREVEIVITPTEAEYRELVSDLAVLRKQGAESNTAAILSAVRREADMVRSSARHLRAA